MTYTASSLSLELAFIVMPAEISPATLSSPYIIFKTSTLSPSIIVNSNVSGLSFSNSNTVSPPHALTESVSAEFEFVTPSSEI